MFRKAGKRIKVLAKINFWIFAIVALFIGFGLSVSISDWFEIGYLLICILAILPIWIFSLFVYGFGEIVENSQRNNDSKIDY